MGARDRVIRRAAELVVATQALTSLGCHRSSGEFEDGRYGSPHQASDPVAPPCRIARTALALRGSWVIFDGVRGVILEGLPDLVQVANGSSQKPAPGGRFVALQEPRLALHWSSAEEPYCADDYREVALPPDGPFNLTVP